MKVIAVTALALVVSLGSAVQASVIQDNGISGSITNSFAGEPDGFISGLVVRTGATYGERFSGQTSGNNGGFETLSGAPTTPLTILANPVATDNLGISIGRLTGEINGTLGEGAISILLDGGSSVFGLTAGGSNNGMLTAQFWGANGADLGSVNVVANDQFYGFRSTGDLIWGISLTHNDPFGLGFSSFTFDNVVTPPVPLPAGGALLIGALGVLGWMRRKA